MAHAHDVFDRDPHFVIDADTRTITDLSETGTSLMQYDHNSERITFEIPREIDDHDMSECDRVEIHYINIGTNGVRNTGLYEVDDLTADVDEDGYDVAKFTWLISQNATSLDGTLSFMIRFVCSSDGNYDYVWSTAIYNKISVGTGMNNAETIATQYADILARWYNELLAMGDQVGTDMATALAAEIEDEKQAAIETIQVQADEIVNLVLERLPRAEEASF